MDPLTFVFYAKGSQNALADPVERSCEGKISPALVEEQYPDRIKPGHAPLSSSNASRMISQSCSSSGSNTNCQPVDKVLGPSQERSGDPVQPSSPGPSADGTKDCQTKAPSSSDRGHYGGVRPKTAKVLHRKNTPALLPKVEKLYGGLPLYWIEKFLLVNLGYGMIWRGIVK